MQKQGKINYLIFLILSMLFSSCQENNQTEKLTQARNIINDKPKDALILLESIPHAETMEEKDYMLYLVTKTDAKLRIKQDVTNDTLIYKAQNYYNIKNDQQNGALVNYFAGKVAYDRLNDDKAMYSYLMAEYYARKTNDNLMIAKSIHCIGNLYFIQQKMNTAIVRYKEADLYYSKVKDSDSSRMLLIYQIGRTYENINSFDSAFVYYDTGFSLAKKLEDEQYQTTFTHLLGIVLREKGDYGQSEKYLNKALSETADEAEALRIHLSLARLYIKLNKSDVAQLHIEEIKNSLSQVKDNITLRGIYQSLADFYKLNADYQEVYYYNELEKDVIQKISNNNEMEKLMNVEREHQIYIKNKDADYARQKIIIILGIVLGVAFFLVFIAALLLRNKRLKFEKEKKQNQLFAAENQLLSSENQLLAAKNEILTQKLERFSFLKNIQQHLIHDWAEIDMEVQELAQYLGAKEAPLLYQRIKTMVEEIKNKSNQNLIQFARDYLRKLGVGVAKIKQIPEMQLLIFILIEYEYSKEDIFAILGLDKSKDEDLFATQLKIIRKSLRQNSIYFKEIEESKENEM